MRKEKSQLIPQKYQKKKNSENTEQLYANKLENPEETDNFLEIYSPPKNKSRKQ